MVMKTIDFEEKEKKLAKPMTSLDETAETICDNAIAAARKKLTKQLQSLSLQQLLQRHDFCDYLKYDLAFGVGMVLAAHDKNVQAIYYFDPHLNPDAETEEYQLFDPCVNLLLQVKTNSAALASYIAVLDRALTGIIRQLPATHLAGMTSLINVLLVTDADLAKRRGNAAILLASFALPKKMWARS